MIFLIIAALIVAGIVYALCCSTKVALPVSPCNGALIVGLLTFFALFLFFKPSNVSKESNALIVGVSADFPPFSFIKDDAIVGFDIDIIEEISRRIHKKIELRNMPFGTLIPSLQIGTIHVIAAGLTATPERAQQILFTTPYLEDGPLVIVSLSAKPVKTIEDLHGKEIVVNEGHTADLYISKIKGLNIRRLKSPADAFLALKSGRSFALVVAGNTVKPFFDQYGEQLFSVHPIPGTGENSCLAVSPKHPDLLKQLQQALDAMKADGSLQQLRLKWGL